MTFSVHNLTGCGKSYLGERDTIEEAERLARWHAARRGWRVEVFREHPPTRTKARRSERVLACERDALGRLWTDIMTPVGEPALL